MLVCEILTEARKNPELNKKITTLNQLKAIAKKYPKQQLYATFTMVHKLGINPRYPHDTTPLGIYVYPLKYVISKKLDVPYMSEAPYIQVVSIAEQSIPKIWYLGDEQSSLIAKQRLQEKFPGITWTGGDTGKDVWYSLERYVKDYCPKGTKHAMFMRQVLVKCGFDGVIDNKGKGIIHLNEPTQGVFFSKQAIKLLQVLDNRPRISNVSLRADDLATSGNMSAHHAFTIIEGKGRRVKNLEPYILQDVDLTIKYVRMFPKQFVNGRWPEGERIVLSTMKPNDVAKYATAVIKGRWPEAEPIILNSDYAAYYASTNIKGRWPEAEPNMLKTASGAVEYAKTVIKGRWLEAEPKILTSPTAIVDYAYYVIKGRWPMGEKVLLDNEVVIGPNDPPAAWRLSGSNTTAIMNYACEVIKGRWPEAEKAICSTLNRPHVYAKFVIKGRWPEAEEAILKAQHADAATRYAINIFNNRWPEAEPFIKKDPEARGLYRAWIKYKL